MKPMCLKIGTGMEEKIKADWVLPDQHGCKMRDFTQGCVFQENHHFNRFMKSLIVITS